MALVKSILFVDGENLTMRYQAMVKAGRKPTDKVIHIPDVFLWTSDFSYAIRGIQTDLLRINYYTSVVGSEDKLAEVRNQISKHVYNIGMDDYYRGCQLHPCVYKKAKRSDKSRLVDINIVIDVMRQSYTDSIDVMYLFSGDGDFISLIKDVMRRGKKVCVGALSSGLNPTIPHSVDRFINLDASFFEQLEPKETDA